MNLLANILVNGLLAVTILSILVVLGLVVYEVITD